MSKQTGATSPQGIGTSKTARFALTLTGIAGYLDAYAMITHGAFAAAQTGNLVFITLAIAQGRIAQHINAILSLLSFVIGASLAIRFKRVYIPHSTPNIHPTRWLLVTLAGLLFALGFLPHSAPESAIIVPLVLTAGILYELFGEIEGHKVTPVTMTSNLVRLIEASYDLLVDRNLKRTKTFQVNGGVIASYLAGVFLASILVKRFGVHSIWAAGVAMLILLTFFFADDRKTKGRRSELNA